MNYIVKNINQLLDDKRRRDAKDKPTYFRYLVKCVPCMGRFEGNYVIILYLITKVIYILNNIAQIFLISGFLGHSFLEFGQSFIQNLLDGKGWTVTNSDYFPSLFDY